LKGSEIFAVQGTQPHPETYFLMRRSSDGFCSATGMFKIAFPWATHAEEKQEREYLKTIDVTSSDEVAGNIWVKEQAALDLAEEYGLTEWLKALLDPAEITQTPTSAKKQPIAAPPKFEVPSALDSNPKLAPKGRGRGAGSTRLRSASPIKIASPVKPQASPRKRQTKAQKEAAIANANAASASLQNALDDAVSNAGAGDGSVVDSQQESTPATSPAPTSTSGGGNVKVDIDQEVEHRGKNIEVTKTNVTVEMPAEALNPAAPTDTEGALDAAKEIVEKVVQLEASSSLKVNNKKRKFDDVDASDLDKELPQQAAKRARVLEEGLKREKVRNRALVGVAATLSIA
jgi:hypothetical protein